eukprot:scaffold104156_cov17-Prasinocladus_malaysianus.AAC.1
MACVAMRASDVWASSFSACDGLGGCMHGKRSGFVFATFGWAVDHRGGQWSRGVEGRCCDGWIGG